MFLLYPARKNIQFVNLYHYHYVNIKDHKFASTVILKVLQLFKNRTNAMLSRDTQGYFKNTSCTFNTLLILQLVIMCHYYVFDRKLVFLKYFPMQDANFSA